MDSPIAYCSEYSETIQRHQALFDALAQAWLDQGASAFQLLEAGQDLFSRFESQNTGMPRLTTQLDHGEMTLCIHGLSDPSWQSLANAQSALISQLLKNENDSDHVTAALVETQDTLIALYEFSQASRRLLETEELLTLLVDESKRLLRARGAFAYLTQTDKPMILRQTEGTVLTDQEIQKIMQMFNQDPRRHTYKHNPALPEQVQNLLLVKISVYDKVSALLGVYNGQYGEFKSPDVKLAQTIADLAGARLENALIYKERLQNTRLEAELSLARDVQAALLPGIIPQTAGIDLFGASLPANEVGGDFFDILKNPEQKTVFLVGDVTGKGMPAALMMAMARTITRNSARKMKQGSPADLIIRLNEDLFEDMSKVGMFTTIFIGVYDSELRQLSYGNAGHSPVFHLSQGQACKLLPAEDMPTGILEGHHYGFQSLHLFPGDVVVVASDGFNETCNDKGELYGLERMMAVIESHSAGSAREIAQGLFDAVASFSNNERQHDDRTIIVLKVR